MSGASPSSPRSLSSAGSSRRPRSSPEVLGLHSPLGRSASHSHYIAPVPPTYVTEYESAFRWPDPSFYAQHSHAAAGAMPAERARDQSLVDLDAAWEELAEAVRALPAEAVDEHGKTALLQAVLGRELHVSVESMLRHLREREQRHDGSPDHEERCRRFLEAASRLKGSSSHKPRPK